MQLAVLVASPSTAACNDVDCRGSVGLQVTDEQVAEARAVQMQCAFSFCSALSAKLFSIPVGCSQAHKVSDLNCAADRPAGMPSRCHVCLARL